MLRTATRLARALPSSAAHALAEPASRGMCVGGVKAMKDRESAAENLYFNKEEERLLRKLMKKMKAQADHHDEDATMHNSEEGKALESIVSKYKISEEDLKALVAWKHN